MMDQIDIAAIDLANAQQRAASDPAVSAFVAASAGSGKTKLLTDRLLRLMLAGAAPSKILCLTYTKAAAAEMQNRLNARLAAWVVMDDAALAAALAALGVVASPPVQVRARRLFAEVLDAPGGMRIATIHAFCQSLLRRFPLEAGLSPHFSVADEVSGAADLRAAREAVLAQGGLRDAIAALAAQTNELAFAGLTAALVRAPQGAVLATPPARLAAMQALAIGAGDETEDGLLGQAVRIPDEAAFRQLMETMAACLNKNGQGFAARALAWLRLPEALRGRRWDEWLAAHYTAEGLGDQRKLTNVIDKTLQPRLAEITGAIDAQCAHIESFKARLRATALAALNNAFTAVAAPVRARESGSRAAAASLSYADLIAYTGRLFENPGAAWILYKLDGGIEHLLLDEVQDTAPAQWEIAGHIADEFFAGQGAVESVRTVFAVGDPKQSIYSFQGADLASFETYRSLFRDRARHAGQTFLDGRLSVSFRSTQPVLALVDAVFAQAPARAGVYGPDEVARHELSRAGQAGRVELWPLTIPAPAAARPGWAVRQAYEAETDAVETLAGEIAEAVAARLAAGLPAGDVLILVRRRNALVGAMMRAMKQRGIAVAGLDRMVLTAQLAVQDVLALCDALLLPDDDLALAQFLVSPFCDLSDDSLQDLALGRRGRLVAALYARAAERPDWRQAQALFETLRARVDFATPFALLTEALGTHGGRARLLARLGPEAAEPLDELLAEALAFSRREPGGLQHFVFDVRQAGADIKREAEAGGNAVRIMTVHGAKGLQARLVILPDTVSLPAHAQKETLLWLPVPQSEALVPVFCPRAGMRPPAVAAAVAQAVAREREEYNRLLYVALTRAQDEIIICGTHNLKNLPDGCWYQSVQAGFSRLPAILNADGRLVYALADAAAYTLADHAAPATPPARARPPVLPGWMGSAPDWQAAPPAAETTRPERLAPSRSGGAEGNAMAASPLAAGAGGRRDAAMARGRAIHALLQHLPGLPDPRAAAARYLSGIAALADEAPALVEAVMAVMQQPALAALFGPHGRAEVPFAGVVGDVEIGGLVDRLVVTAGEIVIADFKTDRAVPGTAAEIPPAYVRQMAAYRAIMGQIHPGLPVRCVLIWTETAATMTVPPAMLDAAAPA
jgi:ATP-dependent helicase/nuclease subunit A